MNKLCLFLISICFASCAYSQRGSVLKDSFDKLISPKWSHKEGASDNSIKISDSISRSGKTSLRFELNSSDNYVRSSMRSELVTRIEKSPNIERWYKFSIFIPEDYQIDPLPEGLAQWHDKPDLPSVHRSPPISLRTENGSWKVVVRWASLKLNNTDLTSGSKRINLGNYEKGKWTDWIFHIKYSYNSDGVLEIWKNGNLVTQYLGPNYYNDKQGPYFKIGIYKWNWKGWKNRFRAKKKRVVYFDDVEISDTSLIK